MHASSCLLTSAHAVALALTAVLLSSAADAAAPARWPAEKAWDWYLHQPWPCGFNYVPANAISYTEMWMDHAFDPALIDKELTLAQDAGFNSLRVVLPFVVWEAEPAAFRQRLDTFLGICARRGLKVMFALFDDCVFGPIEDPVFGRQPEVVPGWYANGWTPSPGHKLVRDVTSWPRLEKYVKDVVGRFAHDPRVWLWDLYNEPGNSGLGDASVPLVAKVFDWARAVHPTQPLSVGQWGDHAALNTLIDDRSDVITFHDYSPAASLASHIESLRRHGRPLICTEWLNRGTGSSVADCLPVLQRGGVGALHWGLVNGKTQTNLNWGHRPGQPDPKVWQHDLFRPDHTPYDATELALFRDANRDAGKEPVTGRWPASQAWAWESRQPWLVGCNFVPSGAVNDVEMWQAESFDAATMARELGWAHDLGFNTVRVFLNYVVWEADAAGLKQRFDTFLGLADNLDMRVVPILFDDCFKPEPHVGKQDEPVPGVHNSQWVRSPGVSRAADHAVWPKLEQYVKDMVGAFGQDRRVVVWDLYNEPAKESQALVEATFRWAREARPSQPLASCWIAEPLSDLVNLHEYGPLSALKGAVAKAVLEGRPILVTEWMARGNGSRFASHLPYFKEHKIGCWNWGLVAGRTQTYFPWGSPQGAPEPPLWHHDILRRDGTPYDAREVATIRYLTGVSPTPPPARMVVVPTAEKEALLWRSTLQKPAADWFRPGFDDSGWKELPAPFGQADANIGRHPRTLWTSDDIWLRREFDLPAGDFTDFALTVHYDEDPEIYLDGILAAKLPGYNASYESYPIAPEAAARLTPGRHLWAIHCHQTVGGQYIDVGIEADRRQ
jgi:hypothetical protein